LPVGDSVVAEARDELRGVLRLDKETLEGMPHDQQRVGEVVPVLDVDAVVTPKDLPQVEFDQVNELL
jgi:hypothetical protein